jgi:hypothetical protein
MIPNWLRNSWHNGGKTLILAFAAFLLSVVVAGGLAAVYFTLGAPQRANVVDFAEPVQVTPSVVRVGETIYTTSMICNNSDKVLGAYTLASWQRVGPGIQLISAEQLNFVLEPGCFPVSGQFEIPPELTPGIWIRVGTLFTTEGDEAPIAAPYRSERFEVVE